MQVMVALAIGAIISAGLIEILVSGKRTYRVQAAQARLQENGRFAMQLLSNELRVAGYMGCPNLDAVTLRVLVATPPIPTFKKDTFLETYETEATGTTWSPDLPDEMTTTDANALTGSDAISIHRGANCNAPLATAMANDSSALTIETGHGCEFAAGDILLVSDCANAEIFVATAVSGPDTTIEHGDSSGLNTEARFAKQYGTDAVVMKLQETSFFIANGASGRPALFRSIDRAAAVELVDGIENLQILYGEDLNGSLSADRYQKPNAVGFKVEDVVSLRLEVLLQSLEDNITLSPQTYTFGGTETVAADGRLRRTFSSMVNLRNRTTVN